MLLHFNQKGNGEEMYVLTARWILNNYMLGAKLKSAPTHKIIIQNRLDSKKTEVIFASLTEREYEFINKLLGKQGKILERLEVGTC